MAAREKFTTVKTYLASLTPEATRAIREVRKLVKDAVPEAREVISYNILGFAREKPFMYCAGFKGHIGIYPPVQGDAKLMKALVPYSNEKGNLRFPFDAPIPWPLIRRVIKALAKPQ